MLKNQGLSQRPLDFNQTLSTNTLNHLGGYLQGQHCWCMALHGLGLENLGNYPSVNEVAETALEGLTHLFHAVPEVHLTWL